MTTGKKAHDHRQKALTKKILANICYAPINAMPEAGEGGWTTG